ncbi:MAG: CRISPR-associated RAMP protein Csx10 [Scytonematopsis contorta HA4267-MV1]|nr:CRISPR-associated RAMP protein Csx10 [Scytonematopsis contorta HA4267-MV1]
MKRIQLEIKALSPLAISRQKPGGSISKCEDYIPGSVIRGTIASEILKQYGQQFTNLSKDGGDFQALFLDDEPAIFQNAYPAVLKFDEDFVIQKEIKVLPATALSSKTKSGFKAEGNNGIFDTLVDRFCANSYDYTYDPNCPTDGKRVDPPSFSFYSFFNDEYHKHSASKRLLTRVGINRRRATSEEDILYSVQVLEESNSNANNPIPVIYTSSILVPDDLADSLWKFIYRNRLNFRIGGSTSRGLGKVEIKAEKPIDIQNNLQEKIANFNLKLRSRWDKWQIFGSPLKQLPENRTYFSLDLQADAILTEQCRSTTVVSVENLQKIASVTDKSLLLESIYSSYDYRSGWNSAWGLQHLPLL